MRTIRKSWASALFAIFMCVLAHAEARAQCSDHINLCASSARDSCGPTAQWVLAVHPPRVKLTGSLGKVLLPFLRKNGIPVSFISRPSEDVSVEIEIGDSTSTKDILDQVLREAPDYRYGVIEDKVVLYPSGQEYEDRVEVTPLKGVTRAKAMLQLLKNLRERSAVLRKIEPLVLRSNILYGQEVEIGGTLSVVDHLASLVRKRTAAAFEVLPTGDGNLSFDLVWVPTVQRIELKVSAVVQTGSSFDTVVAATLVDGTRFTVAAKGCGVVYRAGPNDILKIDGAGRATALREGLGTIQIQYEDQFAQAEVHVLGFRDLPTLEYEAIKCRE